SLASLISHSHTRSLIRPPARPIATLFPYTTLFRSIVTSKAKLEEKLETVVDCWVQPGYSLSLGNYDGFGTGQSEERYRDYYAGKIGRATSELQSRFDLVCRLLLEKNNERLAEQNRA